MTKSPFVEMFEDPQRAAQYAQGPMLFTPGFTDMHRMVDVLLRERCPADAHVLVHGAGGGLELEALAQANPAWTFVGVDPAEAMLHSAASRLGEMMGRIELHHGYIDTAPVGPFDAATSLLTLHFLSETERVETMAKIIKRLKGGAPFVAVHIGFPQEHAVRKVWLDRYAAYAVAAGADPEMAAAAREAIAAMTTLYDPSLDVEMMEAVGLTDVSTFYTAFTWRGWVGYAPV